MKKYIIVFVVLLMAMSMVILGCGEEKTSNERVKAVFADADWDSIKFHNAVAMYIGETAYGIDAEEISGTTAVTYTALKSGDVSVYMEVWSDNLAYYQKDVEEGAVKELSVNFDDNAQGFYVPRYVIEGDADRGIEAMAPQLKSVEDLKDYNSVFTDPDNPSRGRIYGAISGWEVDNVMRSKYAYYGLDEMYNYIDPGSGSALAASIAAAYEKGEPIVAYYWEPTWITGKYDLVLLEDAPYDSSVYSEGKCECPSVKVTVCVNNDFYKAAPDFCQFLSNYKTSSALTAEALSYIQENDASYMDAAKWFLLQHEELIDKWLPQEKAQLIRQDLNK